MDYKIINDLIWVDYLNVNLLEICNFTLFCMQL